MKAAKAATTAATSTFFMAAMFEELLDCTYKATPKMEPECLPKKNQCTFLKSEVNSPNYFFNPHFI